MFIYLLGLKCLKTLRRLCQGVFCNLYTKPSLVQGVNIESSEWHHTVNWTSILLTFIRPAADPDRNIDQSVLYVLILMPNKTLLIWRSSSFFCLCVDSELTAVNRLKSRSPEGSKWVVLHPALWSEYISNVTGSSAKWLKHEHNLINKCIWVIIREFVRKRWATYCRSSLYMTDR